MFPIARWQSLLHSAYGWWLFHLSAPRRARSGREEWRLWEEGPLAPEAAPVVVCLAERHVLSRQIKLPVPAFASLERALAARVEVEWPLAGPAPAWSYRVDRQAWRRGELLVCLAMVPQERVREALDAARNGEINITRLDAIHGSQPAGFAFDKPARPVPRWIGDLATFAAASYAALALVGGLYLADLDRQRQEAETALAAARQTAAPMLALRQSLMRDEREVAEFLATIKGQPRVTDTLADLTDTLSDETWLTRVEIDGGEVSITGRSSDAARALAQIEGSGPFQEPGFTAPILRNGTPKLDRFTIAFQMTQPR